MSAQTATEYATLYREAFDADTLTQGDFHTERDGRQLACALGVIGPDVDSASKCPARIMPRWLAQMVPAFFDRQKADDAKAWGLAFTGELARLNGDVPFSVVHDWHGNVVGQLGIDAAVKRNRNPAPYKALQVLHLRALAGEKIDADQWQPVLKNAYANAYAYAYANAYDNAYAYANAYDNAYADAYAYANAYANADADAYAYAWKLLADGMVECLKRAPAPDGGE